MNGKDRGHPPLEQTVGHLVRRAQQVHQAAWVREVSAELTSPQFAVLHALDYLKRADQTTLARVVSLDRSTTGEIIARLECRGYVQRQRAIKDGRRYEVTLTASGCSALHATAERAHAVNRALVEELDIGDRELFLRLLRTFVTSNERRLETARTSTRMQEPRNW